VLQILGWILAGILLIILLITLLMLPNVRLHFSGKDGQMKASAHYLFLRFRIHPAKEKREKKRKKREKKPKEEKKKRQELKRGEEEKAPLLEMLKQYKPLIAKSKKVLRKLCKRLVIYKVRANVKIVGADAHQTALKYSKGVSFAAILLQILGWAFTVKKPDIVISPDFLGQKITYEFSLRVRIRPIAFVIAGMQLLPAYLKVSKQNNKTQKGGKNNESETSDR